MSGQVAECPRRGVVATLGLHTRFLRLCAGRGWTAASLRQDYPFLCFAFASTSSCFFFGSLRCSAQRKRKRGPFERFLQPG
jgi:hypothetical protein